MSITEDTRDAAGGINANATVQSSTIQKCILIVDDHLTNRLKISLAVKHLGHTTELAENGIQALEILRSKKIDLILLDILMPEMNGYEVLTHLKADELLHDIPVIVISSLDEMDSIVTCIERGAEDYLPKDFEKTLLKARIGASLEKKQLRDEVVQQLSFIRDLFGKYVPESVAREIVDQRSVLEPNRTCATVLFADIEGFTATAEYTSPEKVLSMLNEYFAAVIVPITRYGGVVNQFQGDAVLVTFNIPVADEQHADNAIKAAIGIQAATNGQKFGGVTLRTRIGINTGDVIAGNVGSGERFNYTVIGDAVNLAARLEQLNKEYKTSVLVSDSTVELLEGEYSLTSIGEITIRGKQEAVQIHELVIANI